MTTIIFNGEEVPLVGTVDSETGEIVFDNIELENEALAGQTKLL